MRHGTTAVLVGIVVAALAPPAAAHESAAGSVRELIRIQGYRTGTPPSATGRRVVFRALGEEHPFAADAWQVFSFVRQGSDGEAAGERATFALQGSREDLARFAASRPEQRVTLLVERRPASADLFIVAIDLCPAR